MTQKFLFNQTFEDKEGRPVWPELEEARLKGYQEGKEAGYHQAVIEAPVQASRILKEVQSQLSHLLQEHQKFHQNLTHYTLEIVRTIMQKALPCYIERYGEEEIKLLVQECFAAVKSQGQVVVEIHPDLKEAIGTYLHDILPEGKHSILLKPNSEFNRNDCKISWDDGGVYRDLTSIEADIERALNLPALQARGDSDHAFSEITKEDNEGGKNA